MCIGTSNPELWTRVVHTIWWRCITCTYLHCRACTTHPPSCLPSFYILTIGIVLKEKPLGRGQLDSETTNFAHWTLSLLSLLPKRAAQYFRDPQLGEPPEEISAVYVLAPAQLCCLNSVLVWDWDCWQQHLYLYFIVLVPVLATAVLSEQCAALVLACTCTCPSSTEQSAGLRPR